MERAFGLLSMRNPLRTLPDGKSTIAYLAGAAPFNDRASHPLPAIVILDLLIPRKDGAAVLTWIRSQPEFASIPVIVLTAIDQPTEVERAYALGANGFFIKPKDPTQFVQLVAAIREYWLSENPARTEFVDITAFRPPTLQMEDDT